MVQYLALATKLLTHWYQELILASKGLVLKTKETVLSSNSKCTFIQYWAFGKGKENIAWVRNASTRI